MKLARIIKNKVSEIMDGDIENLPDNSHFINIDNHPEIEIGWNYDGEFSPPL